MSIFSGNRMSYQVIILSPFPTYHIILSYHDLIISSSHNSLSFYHLLYHLLVPFYSLLLIINTFGRIIFRWMFLERILRFCATLSAIVCTMYHIMIRSLDYYIIILSPFLVISWFSLLFPLPPSLAPSLLVSVCTLPFIEILASQVKRVHIRDPSPSHITQHIVNE